MTDFPPVNIGNSLIVTFISGHTKKYKGREGVRGRILNTYLKSFVRHTRTRSLIYNPALLLQVQAIPPDNIGRQRSGYAKGGELGRARGSLGYNNRGELANPHPLGSREGQVSILNEEPKLETCKA